MSKITDAAFTFCKVRLKNVFHVKKYLQVWIFVCIFVLFKKRTIVNTIFGYLFQLFFTDPFLS